MYKGLALAELGRFQDAVAAMDRAAQLLPTNFVFPLYLGCVRLDEGQAAAASQAFARAAALAPTNPLISSYRFLADFVSGDKQALHKLAPTLTQTPDGFKARLLLSLPDWTQPEASEQASSAPIAANAQTSGAFATIRRWIQERGTKRLRRRAQRLFEKKRYDNVLDLFQNDRVPSELNTLVERSRSEALKQLGQQIDRLGMNDEKQRRSLLLRRATLRPDDRARYRDLEHWIKSYRQSNSPKRARPVAADVLAEMADLDRRLVAEQIDDELRLSHDLVVVNPDGFQGDERDVLLYSLSYDATNMEQAALSARQADRPHIQGMLNVAFTRAREEMHVFHSAPIEQFGMASGEGAIKDWLAHCAKIETTTFDPGKLGVQRAQSEFEVQVMEALRTQGFSVIPQYPSCGFFIDLVAQKNDIRIAVECDGEIWHEDEHGNLRTEDVQRQEVLERAGWRVLRIPYRKWRADTAGQIARVTRALTDLGQANSTGESAHLKSSSPLANSAVVTTRTISVNSYEAAVLKALRGGAADRENVLRAARIHLQYKALGSRIRASIESAISSLQARKLVAVEESELFAIGEGKDAMLSVAAPRYSRRRRYYGRRSR
jgi:very-short-patch-repair endonuclease